MTTAFACRLCGAPLERTFVDLGVSPPRENILRADQLEQRLLIHDQIPGRDR